MFPADAAPGARRATGPVVRIPPNFFGIALGLSGLAELWLDASDAFGATAAHRRLARAHRGRDLGRADARVPPAGAPAGVLLAGWLTGQWMKGGLEEETVGPAIIPPGVGIGFTGSVAASTVRRALA